MSKVIICQGLPASGKTSYARAWVLEDPENRIRFNRDDIRNMMGKYWIPSREKIINAISYTFMQESMLSGRDIILDNMNLNPKTISEIKKNVEEFNEWISKSPLKIHYDIEIKSFLDVPLDVCVDRDARREVPLGKDIILGIYNRYKDTYNI